VSPCSGRLHSACLDRGNQEDVLGDPTGDLVARSTAWTSGSTLVLPNDARPSMGKLLDLEMSSVAPGGQRTVAEYEELLTRAGLDSTEMVAALPGAPASYGEAVPVHGWDPPR
jgi:hypothetical protein